MKADGLCMARELAGNVIYMGETRASRGGWNKQNIREW
jgi:hypothetical protein